MRSMERCRKAELYGPDGHILCEALVSAGPFDDLILNVPASFPYETSITFRVTFFHPIRGLIQTVCALSGGVLHPDQRFTIRCKILETVREEERRRHPRIPVDLDLEAALLRSPSGFKPDTLTFPVRTRDISAGGVYLTCPYDLEAGTLLLFRLSMVRPPLRLTARVLHSERLSQDGGVLYGLGCQFVSMDGPTESGLRSFVQQQQQMLLRR